MSQQRAALRLAVPVPIDEGGRLAAVNRVVHDPTRGRPVLDALVLVAQRLLDVPTVKVSMLDQSREVVLADVRSEGGTVPRDQSLCAHAILQHDPLVVADLERDQRLTIAVQGERAYIGAPIRTPDGHALGALAGVDTEPREFTEQQANALSALAALAAEALEGEALAERLVQHAIDDLRVDLHLDDPIEEVLANAMQVVVDHEAWRIAWGHIGIDGRWSVVGSAGVDPNDLDMGLALYEMRHRLEGLHPGGSPFLVDVSSAPSSLARVAERLDVSRFLVVPMAIADGVHCSVVLGMKSPPEHRSALVRALGDLARQIAAEVTVARQARAPQQDLELALAQLRAIDDLWSRTRVGLAQALQDPLRLVHAVAREHVDGPAIRPHGAVLDAAVASEPDLGRLLDDVVDLAQRRGAAHRTEVVVPDVVAAATQRALDGHGRPASVTLRLESVRATIEVERVGRAVEELVDNALRHTPAGTSVTVAARAVGDDRFVVTVADDGPGLPDELKAAAFTPSKAGWTGGVGLGLVAGVAALHDGRAWVDDRPGGGARFHLELQVS